MYWTVLASIEAIGGNEEAKKRSILREEIRKFESGEIWKSDNEYQPPKQCSKSINPEDASESIYNNP
jgi:hypothetical protein